MRFPLVPAALVLAVAAAAPAAAQERSFHQSIEARDYARAERRLVAERRRSPGRVEVMLNLAAVYLETGRAEQAKALYAEVLDAAPVAMDMPSGRVASSHAVADLGLARMGNGTAIASR